LNCKKTFEGKEGKYFSIELNEGDNVYNVQEEQRCFCIYPHSFNLDSIEENPYHDMYFLKEVKIGQRAFLIKKIDKKDITFLIEEKKIDEDFRELKVELMHKSRLLSKTLEKEILYGRIKKNLTKKYIEIKSSKNDQNGEIFLEIGYNKENLVFPASLSLFLMIVIFSIFYQYSKKKKKF
jgi:hypothetical protein